MNRLSFFRIESHILLWILFLLFCFFPPVWETASASQEQNRKQTELESTRTLVEQNEALMSLIKMDFTIRKTRFRELSHFESEGGERKGTGRPYTHMEGTWAQDDIKQYSNIDWFSADGYEKGHISIVDGEVKILASKPDLKQVGINKISSFEWYMNTPARLGFRVKGGRYRLSEVLVPEFAAILDRTELIRGHETCIVDVRSPLDDPSYCRIWIDRKRGMPLRIEYYHDKFTKPIREIKDIRLLQLPNGGWIPIEGVSSLYWRPSSEVSSEHIVVDVNSITIRREDIPDSLFKLDIPKDAIVTNRITGITTKAGQVSDAKLESIIDDNIKFMENSIVKSESTSPTKQELIPKDSENELNEQTPTEYILSKKDNTETLANVDHIANREPSLVWILVSAFLAAFVLTGIVFVFRSSSTKQAKRSIE
jgi:hypothetical protein